MVSDGFSVRGARDRLFRYCLCEFIVAYRYLLIIPRETDRGVRETSPRFPWHIVDRQFYAYVTGYFSVIEYENVTINFNILHYTRLVQFSIRSSSKSLTLSHCITFLFWWSNIRSISSGKYSLSSSCLLLYISKLLEQSEHIIHGKIIHRHDASCLKFLQN